MPHRKNQLENYALWEQYNPRTGHWLSDTKDILIRFLQDFFFQMPAGQNCYHFEPGGNAESPLGETDEQRSEVIIGDQGSVSTDSVEKRPAIIISRGPFAYGNTSLDHMLNLDGQTGKRTHTDLISGSFVVNCVARKGLEAETLAILVAKGIRIFRRELQKAGFFYIGHLVQIGQETPGGSLVGADTDEDFVNVPVTFPIYYQESWTVERDALLLKALSVKLQYVARKFDGTLLVPGSVDENGDPVEGSKGVIVQAWTVQVP